MLRKKIFLDMIFEYSEAQFVPKLVTIVGVY